MEDVLVVVKSMSRQSKFLEVLSDLEANTLPPAESLKDLIEYQTTYEKCVKGALATYAGKTVKDLPLCAAITYAAVYQGLGSWIIFPLDYPDYLEDLLRFELNRFYLVVKNSVL